MGERDHTILHAQQVGNLDVHIHVFMLPVIISTVTLIVSILKRLPLVVKHQIIWPDKDGHSSVAIR